MITSNHAGGKSVVNTFLVNVYLPNGLFFKGIKVIEGNIGGDVEMLIGMDIIGAGDFSISNYNNKTTFSFRIPSVREVDFRNESASTLPEPV